MKLAWNLVKSKTNKLKHGIFFTDVEPVFYDPRAIVIEDRNATGESRYLVIGKDALERVVVVVYTYRAEIIWIISARKANRAERITYEK